MNKEPQRIWSEFLHLLAIAGLVAACAPKQIEATPTEIPGGLAIIISNEGKYVFIVGSEPRDAGAAGNYAHANGYASDPLECARQLTMTPPVIPNIDQPWNSILPPYSTVDMGLSCLDDKIKSDYAP